VDAGPTAVRRRSAVEPQIRQAPPVAGRAVLGDPQVAGVGRSGQVDGGELPGARPAGRGPPVGTVVADRQLPLARVVAEVVTGVEGDLPEPGGAPEVDLHVLAGCLGRGAGPAGGAVAVEDERRRALAG